MFKPFTCASLIWVFILLIHPGNQTIHSKSYSDPVSPLQKEHTEWWVSPNGNDSTGGGSVEKPFGTIQHAIDVALEGDVVVVLEGRYSGPGNKDLDYKGKAITVRSRDPEDSTSLQNTIIDAEGLGVIVRFLYDEGPDSVFEGFSLRGGDNSLGGRGVPGFFALSNDARPTIQKIRIDGKRPPIQASSLEENQTGLPSEKLYWYGNNPFQSPAKTTDYYGSGDVDNNGVLSSHDTYLAHQVVIGLAAPSIRADVDGNGQVDASDVSLFESALSGTILPAWWNNLLSREERDAWVSKVISLDPTNQHPYKYLSEPAWWVCADFAAQMVIHAAYYRGELFANRYDGGQTIFNIPLYNVTVVAPGFGHAINAILIGDNPLNFNDWRFFEPQTDMTVGPGDWSIPYNATVSIGTIFVGHSDPSDTKVVFSVDDEGNWMLDQYSPDLVLIRPDPSSDPPDNHPDLWNPILTSEGMILFDRLREDMSRMTDIHLAEVAVPFTDNPNSTPLTFDTQLSRLLDISQAPDGKYHILWYGKPDDASNEAGLYHAILDPRNRTITNRTRVSPNTHLVSMGRVIVTPSGELHVFWYSKHGYTWTGMPEFGLYWTEWTGNEWAEEQNLTPDLYYHDLVQDWENRQLYRYFFDVATFGENNLLLVWRDHRLSDFYHFEFRQLVYNGETGTWSQSEIPEELPESVRGVDLTRASDGTVHLVYWLGSEQGESSEGRGVLVHRIALGTSWSDPVTIDNSENACCPRLISGNNGEVYVVWERRDGERVSPFWSKYIDNSWSEPQKVHISMGSDAWYPTGEYQPEENNLLLAWSSRSDDLTTIETAAIPQPAPTHLTVNSSTDSGPGSLRWAIASLADGGSIDFNFTQPTTIYITSRELLINKTITIDGGNQATLNAGQRNRVFDILREGALTLKGITLTGGFVQKASSKAPQEGGGAIRNQGSLNLVGSVLKNNQADYGGAIHNSGIATISGSNLMDNQAAYDGGGIYNDGELMVNNTAVVDNHAFGGGGILNWDDGKATFNTCEISGNTATNGGGLENGDRGVLIIQNNSTIDGNEATAIGGGILNYGTGVVEIDNSILSDNSANQNGGGFYKGISATTSITNSLLKTNHARYGGGVLNTGVMTITTTQFSSNSAEFDGGASFNAHGVLTIERSTLGGIHPEDGNHAIGGGGILNWDGGEVFLDDSTLANNQATNGGAIENGANGHVVINNSTLVNNGAFSAGGGVINFKSGEVEILNSTVAWNGAENGGNIKNVSAGKVTVARSIFALAPSGENCSGVVTSSGYNLADDKSCNLQPSLNDLSDPFVQINPLTNAGGPTLTCSLQPGSPAIDRIPSNDCSIFTDQRGVQRQQGPACDIGAFEMVQLSIEDVSVYEGDDGIIEILSNVSYPGNPVQEVQFSYSTADGTAVAMSDYLPVSSTLTISINQTSQTVSVSVIGDKIEESDEFFTVSIDGATNAIIWDNIGEGKILDDDKTLTKYIYFPINYLKYHNK